VKGTESIASKSHLVHPLLKTAERRLEIAFAL
jgi:hypothetical protein